MSKFYKLNAGKQLEIVVGTGNTAQYARQKYGDYDHGDNYVSLSAGTTILGSFTQDRLYEIQPLSGSDPIVNEVTFIPIATRGGVVTTPLPTITYADNGTSRRLKGLDFAGEEVQNYEGIFYHTSYDTWGTLKTRLSYGSNPNMDMILQASNDLLFLCTNDGSGSEGRTKFMVDEDMSIDFHFSDNLVPALKTRLTINGIETQVNVGTVATNVTAQEFGDGHKHKTVLTVTDAVLPAITGGGAESLGVLLYTLPAGAIIIDSAYMSLGIQQQDGNITADTPDGGLGTLLANDSQATLDADDAACENIITGQTFNDCDGTAEVKTVGDQLLVIESGDNHTIYFNVADTWAASGDTGALVSGTVVLNWQLMV